MADGQRRTSHRPYKRYMRCEDYIVSSRLDAYSLFAHEDEDEGFRNVYTEKKHILGRWGGNSAFLKPAGAISKSNEPRYHWHQVTEISKDDSHQSQKVKR